MNDKKAFVPKIGDLVYITDNKSFMKGRSGVVLMRLDKNDFIIKVLENGVSHNVVVKGEGLQENPIMGSGDNVEKGATCEVFDSKGERAIDDKSVQKVTDCVASLKQTKASNINTDGQYTPKRVALHKEIISKFKKGVTCINKGKPIAVLMGGSPASGKSTFLKKYRPYLLSNNIFKIDADEVRAQLPEYKGWNASQTQNETSDIVKTLISDKNIGIPCLFDFIYDGTMTSPTRYIKLVEVLKSQGYQIFIVFMTGISKDVIKKRILNRYKESGRFVPMIVVDDFYANGENTMKSLKGMVDGYLVIDGSDYDYKILEQGGKKLPNKRLYEKLGKTIKMSKGGGVGYYTKQNERLGRPSGSIEKETLAKVTFKNAISEQYFVGSFGWKTTQGKLGDGYLYNLDEFDQNLTKDLKLKSGERVFRYLNRTTAIGGMTPFIKINIEKALLYFPIYNDNEDTLFETKAVKPLWINIIEDKMEKGGGVGNEVYIEFLNKEKGFKKDVKHFNSYNEAVEWAKKNFDKFSPDMIKRKMLKGGDIKAIFSKEGLEASNPFAFKKKLEFAKKHPELLILANGGGVGNPSKKEMLDYLNMYFDNYSELRTIVIEEDNILTRKMLNKLDNEELQMAYDDAKYEIKAETQFANGGAVDMYSKFDINKSGTLSATINDKNYEVIYRDDISGMYDLFENGKKIKSSKSIRDLMQFPKEYKDGGAVVSFKIGEFYVGKNKNIKYKFLKKAKPFGYQFEIYKWDSLNYTYKKDSTPYILDKNELKKYGVTAQKTEVDKKTEIKFNGGKVGWKHKIK